MAIVGRSGSGKSTLLSLIGLFDRPDCGQYLLDGRDISRLSERRAAALRSAEFGFVFQRFFLLKHLTAAQNVAMALVNGQGWLPRRKRRAKVLAALDQVGIAAPGQAAAGPAVRRRAAAGGDRPGAGPPAARAAGRRADRRAGHRDRQPGRSTCCTRPPTGGCGLILVTHDRDHAARMDRIAATWPTACSPGVDGAGVIRLSGRFRSALIIGLQGIRARKTRTLLSMVSLFLGVLAVVVVQAGAEIAKQAALADVELQAGKDGTRQLYLPPSRRRHRRHRGHAGRRAGRGRR